MLVSYNISAHQYFLEYHQLLDEILSFYKIVVVALHSLLSLRLLHQEYDNVKISLNQACENEEIVYLDELSFLS
jgi:hypothetical protein